MTDKRDPTPIVGKWRKQKHYRCRLCSFDTLSKKVFEDHFAKTHPPLQVMAGGKQQEPEVPAIVEPVEPEKQEGKETDGNPSD